MTSPRLLLAAGSVAASLAGIAPVISHGATSASPLQVGSSGVAVSVQQLQAGQSADVKLVVPARVTALAGAASGSPALAARTQLVVTRTGDGATLFTGSLATFRMLSVSPGASLVVHVQKPAGFAGLRAGAELRWS